MEKDEKRELLAAVESILFASGEPVESGRIAQAMELERETVEELLRTLEDQYAYERRGIRLLRMDTAWQLCSAPEYGDLIRRTFEVRKTARLSPSALEVLTTIAYFQPTTRAYVDQVRGVDSAHTLALLLERQLIEECGHLQAPGRPRLYRTTKNFLRTFHLSSLEELPPMPGAEESAPLTKEDGVETA